MSIHSRILSEAGGVPLIVLHGLLGSSRNWLSAGKMLGGSRTVVALDLPDHGESGWSDEPSFAEMAERIHRWFAEQGIGEADWLGHSLGGKAALRIAADHPEAVRRLVLADMFPRVYEPHHKADLETMASLDPTRLADRKEADRALEASVPDWPLRQFLLTNLVRDPGGGFRWQVNLEGLRRNLTELAGLPFENRWPLEIPTLLVYGGKSGFVRPEDLERIGDCFTDGRAVCLPKAGHNVHVEDRDGFVAAVDEFLSESL